MQHTEPSARRSARTTLFAATLYAAALPAQNCTRVDVPLQSFDFGGSFTQSNSVVSADGSRILIQGVPAGSGPEAGSEVFLFNPITGQFRQLTTGSSAAVNFRGEIDRYPVAATAVSSDGSKIFLGGNANFTFPFFALPGQPSQQHEVIEGTPGPAEILNVQTGTKERFGNLGNQPIGPNQIYTAAISAVSADGNFAFLSEEIVTFEIVTSTAGREFRKVISRDQSAGGLLNLSTGEYEDVVSRIVAAADAPDFFPFDGYRMSEDANAFSFYVNRNLGDPLKPFWGFTPGNTSGVQSAAYVYYRDRDQIELIATPDISQAPRPANGSSAIFVRNIGATGRRFAMDRGAPFVGAGPNPTWQAAPSFVDVGQNLRYVVSPTNSLPERGTFTNGLAYISRDERRVYFSHTADLVPGLNPRKSLEFYSFNIDTNSIRQISNLQDGLFDRVPAQILASGDITFQNQFVGASDDGSVVAFNHIPRLLSFARASRSGNGRITVSNNSNFENNELSASLFRMIYRCN